MAVIVVDYRRGSHELIAPLEARGLEVAETELPAGDLAWTGRGERGAPVEVGVEFKTLDEMVESFHTQRLQDQLLRMRGAEPGERPLYDFAWLVFEGEVIFDKRGRLMKRIGRHDFKPLPGKMTHMELLKRLFVLHLRGGLVPLNTESRRETLDVIEALYRTWTDKDLDEHNSHLAIYQPAAMVPLSQFRRTVGSLPGIALRGSLAVEQAFGGSLKKAFAAGVNTWADIKVVDQKGNSKRLGVDRAERIQEAIR